MLIKSNPLFVKKLAYRFGCLKQNTLPPMPFGVPPLSKKTPSALPNVISASFNWLVKCCNKSLPSFGGILFLLGKVVPNIISPTAINEIVSPFLIEATSFFGIESVVNFSTSRFLSFAKLPQLSQQKTTITLIYNFIAVNLLFI